MDKHKHLVPVIFVQKSRLQYHVGHILNEFTEITLFRFLAKNLTKNKNRNKKDIHTIPPHRTKDVCISPSQGNHTYIHPYIPP
jgi:hypothetical protein